MNRCFSIHSLVNSVAKYCLQLALIVGSVQVALTTTSDANNVKSVADTYTRRGSAQYTNFGGNSTLLLMKQDASNHTEAYLRFDISKITNNSVFGSNFWFYVEEIHGIGTPTVGVYVASSLNYWAETSLTWATRPGTIVKVGEAKVDASGGWQRVQVDRAKLQAQLDRGQSNITILLRIETGNQVLYISSKEHLNGAKHPTLSIATPSSPISPYLYVNAEPVVGESVITVANLSTGSATDPTFTGAKTYSEAASNIVSASNDVETCTMEKYNEGLCGAIDLGGITVTVDDDAPPEIIVDISNDGPTSEPNDSESTGGGSSGSDGGSDYGDAEMELENAACPPCVTFVINLAMNFPRVSALLSAFGYGINNGRISQNALDRMVFLLTQIRSIPNGGQLNAFIGPGLTAHSFSIIRQAGQYTMTLTSGGKFNHNTIQSFIKLMESLGY